MVDPSREVDDEEETGSAEALPADGDEARAEAVEQLDDEAPGAASTVEAAVEPGAGDEAEAQAAAEAASEPDTDQDPDVDQDDRTQPGFTAPSAGTRLREAREARGLSLEDLARTLNLHPRIVDALERDDEESLPAAPFVRGYLRSYARLMGMDPAPLLDDHQRRTGGVVVAVVPSPRIEEPAASPGVLHERPGTVMAVATLGFVIIVGALLFLRPETAGRPATAEAPAEVAAGSASSASSQAPREAAATAEVDSADPPTTSVIAPPEAGVADATRAADLEPTPGLLAAPDAPTPAAPDTVPPGASADGGILRTRTADGLGLRVYAGGEDHLRFDFTEDCWVEVRDADDVSVFQDLVRDGEALDLFGRAPFRIRLGYAPAVELTYNGSRVALRPFTRNDVASLTLGR